MSLKSMKCLYGLQLITLYLTLASGNYVSAQIPQTLDSLGAYVETHSPGDTNYVNALLRMGNLTTRTRANYDRADSLLRAAEKLAVKLNFGRGIYQANTFLGANYYLSNRPQKTLEYLLKALTIAEANKLSPRILANAMTNLGTAYRKVNQHEKALEISLRSLHMQEQANLQPRNEDTYIGVGLALKDMKRTREAIMYFQQALVLNRNLKAPYGMAIVEQNIGRCYDDLEQADKALTYYHTAFKHARESESDLLQADILVNMGLVLRKVKRHQEAKQSIERALAISGKQANKEAMATDYFNLGQVYEDLKDYKQAELNMKKALALANELGNNTKIAIYTQGLANLYGGVKDFRQAYVFQLERNQRIDSVIAIRSSTGMHRMMARYETEKKEAQIKLLRQQAKLDQQERERIRFQTRVWLVGGVLLLLLGVAVSAWLLNRSRFQRLNEAQKLRSQIANDLHDEVGSTLSSISILSGHTTKLLNQNRPGLDTSETAQKMVQKIYTDARQILESIDEIIWTINPGNDSLQRIALRLQEYAQPLMESKNIQFSFVIDPALEHVPISMEARRSLYLIGKEAINNLVKYAQATKATVRFERKDSQLQVVIEDNGRGFDPDQPNERTGQTSMKQRAEAMGGSLKIQSTPGQGTRLQLVVNP